MPDTRRVALLTFHRSTNFGSYLQAYALYKKVCDLGCDCEVLDYRCPAVERREGLASKVRGPRDLAKSVLFGPALRRKARALERFSEEHLLRSRPYGPEDINQAGAEYPMFLVGSDIVWGRDITEGDLTYFLDFAPESARKLAFASSVGDYGARDDDAEVGRCLARFDRIAVRESQAVPWVEGLSGRRAELVCDPTMLLTAGEWDSCVRPVDAGAGYVLVYFDSPGGGCLAAAREFAARRGLRVRYVNYTLPAKGVDNVRPASLAEFLGLVKCADSVFTASYHGMLFSLYYGRDMRFFTRAHSSRVLSLAERVGVSDRCGDGRGGVELPPVDYGAVGARIAEFRESSLGVLREMLEVRP